MAIETLIPGVTLVHVLAGVGALLFGALAILLKRNTPKHKIVGKIYFWCMSIIFVTGVFISIIKGLLFLFFIAIFTYYAVLTAYRILSLKQLNVTQKPKTIDWWIDIVAGITFLGLVVFAIYYFVKNQSMDALIPLTFGAMGLLGVGRNMQRLKQKPKEKLHWMKVHIGNMCGSYIGAITAFVVNQSQHIPLPAVVLWLGPTLIITPIIFMELKKVKFVPMQEN